ncbi:phosphatase PAP2 family protein [Modestobacter italicus]|uniref:phosphatase PAP2 family protein n=1 Tax=Modestobacter italicus (strain DSM 44449 / CECT 9708 / BC 501) TaxID=2732864 RepID=UPI0027E12945|nr:phosphatase PAP2 family protein [Modestobacter italicus]
MLLHQDVDRRSFLAIGAVGTALLTVPSVFRAPAAAADTNPADTTAGATHPLLPFVDNYNSNTTANLSTETNAAVVILSGMADLWRTGSSWDTGVAVDPALRQNITHVVQVSRARTAAEAAQSFIYDRQHQSYAVTGGLGPLAELYRTGAKAVTSITAAPDGTPPTKIDDAVPAGAPAGSSLGAGSSASELGRVVDLVNTLRGSNTSSNPSKFTYQYPRPWRMTVANTVVPTGAVDEYGYPVYRSDVVVAPQLLRQRSTTPESDGGYVSGHTNAYWLAALALAYAVPERFQEMVARAAELSDYRIVSGMHSPVDVIGGRILGTALAAAKLHEAASAQVKADARAQALAYFTARTGTTPDTLIEAAHTGEDPYADRAATRRATLRRFTYDLPTRGSTTVPMVVPKGAEALLETRLPYLTAEQRREVLRTTALPSGNPLLDGPELWGRLDLFTAADGYGALDGEVRVVMDAAAGGFSARDTWRNDVRGTGRLVKAGSGTLELAGSNSWTGGTRVTDGTLVARSNGALGQGPVQVEGGALRLGAGATVVAARGDVSLTGGALALTFGSAAQPPLSVIGTATLGVGSRLELTVEDARRWAHGGPVPVLLARSVRGTFGSVVETTGRFDVEPVYQAGAVSVRLRAR